MGKLDGKIAVVTGGTYGLALASAKKFVSEGAYVFITGRDQQKLEKAKNDLGENAFGIQADSSIPTDLDHLFQQVKSRKGRIDILFVSAGMGELNVPLEKITEEHIRKTFDLNVVGTILTVQKAYPLLRDGGSILLTGSIAGSKGLVGMSVYSASKAAIRALGRTWAAELVGRNIRVNTISPGPIHTAVFENVPPEMREKFAAFVPMKRLGNPNEIGTTALFLASDDASFITGAEIFVDGGLAQL